MQDAPARAPTPREAASVIFARDTPGGVEILLLQRHPASRFSPGAFAFPGGRVEPADSAPGIEARCRGLTLSEAAAQLSDVLPLERAIGFWVGAFREAFEEAGILLAYGSDGHPVDLASVGDVQAQRARCRAASAAFGQLLGEHELALAVDRAAYWAHWITPEERPIRYDTRFFVAACPDQTAEPDGSEMVAACWARPDDALARHRGQELVLPLPTQRILASLADHRDVEALLEAARGRPIPAIRPRIVRDQGAERILLPQDPGWF